MRNFKQSIFLTCGLGLMACTDGLCQKRTTSSFIIHLETTSEEVKITCRDGCAWKQQSYTVSGKKYRAINQLGMITMPKKTNEEELDSSSFLVTISKTKKGIKLQGIKGTAWSKLMVTCYQEQCSMLIDRNGSRKI